MYVFKRDHYYLYIGKAKKFGGAKGRYAYGYRYLVDSLLESGVKLWILELGAHWKSVNNLENTLIHSAKGKNAVNRRRTTNFKEVEWLVGP